MSDTQQLGHLRRFEGIARRVDYVTLDGERLKHVQEANDTEGWVTCWDVPTGANVTRHGVVVFVMRPADQPDQPLRPYTS